MEKNENLAKDDNIVNEAINDNNPDNRTKDNLKEENQPKFEEVEIEVPVKEIRTDSYFDGKLIQLIGWNFLRYLLAIVTLGIASPIGEWMYIRFKTSHTILNGKRLKFHGTAGEYFVEKIKWFFLTLITFGIYGLWVPIKKNKWILSKLSFEDEEYVPGESFFDGKLIQLIGINLLCNFLNIISLGILVVFTKCFKLKWLAKHSIINRKKIVFAGSGINLFGHYLLWALLTIVTFGIYGLWLNIKLMQWEVKNTHIKLAGEKDSEKENPILVLMFVIIGICVSLTFILLVVLPIINENVLPNFDNSKGNSQSVLGE